MAFCKNCGAPMDDETKYCPTCGAPVGGPVNPDPNPVQPDYQQAGQNYQAQNNMGGAPNDDATDIANNKVFAILAYFGLLVLIPILAAPNSKFARYHANQGLTLFILEIICMFVGVIPFIGGLIALAGSIFAFVCFIIRP